MVSHKATNCKGTFFKKGLKSTWWGQEDRVGTTPKNHSQWLPETESRRQPSPPHVPGRRAPLSVLRDKAWGELGAGQRAEVH